jgi:transcriptional regulator with XRE-family HTH domain
LVSREEHGLGPRLRALREAAGVSQQALAFRSGLSGSVIARIEQGQPTGQDPRLSTLVALARGLDLTLNELVNELFPPAKPRRGRKGR